MSDQVFSYQTRLARDGVRESALDRYAQLVGHIERHLFAKRAGGGSAIACKNEFLKKFGISARQFKIETLAFLGAVGVSNSLYD